MFPQVLSAETNKEKKRELYFNMKNAAKVKEKKRKREKETTKSKSKLPSLLYVTPEQLSKNRQLLGNNNK